MKTLIFDFDGTLADSFELVVDVAYELTGVPRRTLEEVHALRALPLLAAIHRLGAPWWHIPRLLLHTRRNMYTRMDEVKLFPGISTLLDTLHQDGYRLLIMSSNREQNVRACLRAHNLETYFEGIYQGSVFNKARGLRRILKRNNLQASSVYYIGNEALDVYAAHKVGMRSIAVTWSGQNRGLLEASRPDAIVDRPLDVTAAVTGSTV
jgi:phosphoglycolate phosphatase-like HAD superfamily hydrolase